MWWLSQPTVTTCFDLGKIIGVEIIAIRHLSEKVLIPWRDILAIELWTMQKFGKNQDYFMTSAFTNPLPLGCWRLIWTITTISTPLMSGTSCIGIHIYSDWTLNDLVNNKSFFRCKRLRLKMNDEYGHLKKDHEDCRRYNYSTEWSLVIQRAGGCDIPIENRVSRDYLTRTSAHISVACNDRVSCLIECHNKLIYAGTV